HATIGTDQAELQLVGFCGFIWLPMQLPVLWAMVCNFDYQEQAAKVAACCRGFGTLGGGQAVISGYPAHLFDTLNAKAAVFAVKTEFEAL
ncbi:hypothetical protein O5833_27665, partial [Escherichia coli]|nr:hypothetical protein [Escherichia coli]